MCICPAMPGIPSSANAAIVPVELQMSMPHRARTRISRTFAILKNSTSRGYHAGLGTGQCGPPTSDREIVTTHRLVRSEWFLAVSIATSLAFLLFGEQLKAESAHAAVQAAVFVWLFVTILWSAMSVVRHAEHLAERLGEPLGTLILTLAVTAIEAASISAVMVHSRDQPTVMRDTVFAVIMIILNGMVGTSLLVGAWRHREQSYNLQGANIYFSVVVPLAVMSLIMPNYTQTTPGPTLSFYQQEFLGVMCVGLYAAFLAVQTGRHRGYFALEAEEDGHGHELAGGAAAPGASAWHHALLLLAYMIPVVYLAEQFGEPIDHMIRRLHAPAALGGVIIAALVATPEGSAQCARRSRINCNAPSTSAWGRCSPPSASPFRS
jgi:Ca2+:H+ antiporter